MNSCWTACHLNVWKHEFAQGWVNHLKIFQMWSFCWKFTRPRFSSNMFAIPLHFTTFYFSILRIVSGGHRKFRSFCLRVLSLRILMWHGEVGWEKRLNDFALETPGWNHLKKSEAKSFFTLLFSSQANRSHSGERSHCTEWPFSSASNFQSATWGLYN